jgi:hypothetical protein
MNKQKRTNNYLHRSFGALTAVALSWMMLPLPVTAINGNDVSVDRILPGDVNDDGKVDISDVTVLKQSIAGWNVKINKSNADVTGDGKVTVADVALLKQSLANWNVTLK